MYRDINKIILLTMRRLISLTIILLLPALLFAQSGSGTYLDPFTGTISSNITWDTTTFPSGKVYVSGHLIVEHGYSLNIEGGMTIIFTASDSRILVDGTFNAVGSSGNEILFTADYDDDGNYGESGERWGHLYYRHENLNQSTGYNRAYSSGEINYCIFEYAIGPQTDIMRSRYGGAMKIASINVSVSNSIFRNNTSGWGGAVLVGSKTSDPYGIYNLPITGINISNCYFHDNSSSYGGGAIYFWDLSGGKVSNCIFVENTSSTGIDADPPPNSFQKGGAICSMSGGTSILTNNTFIKNTSNVEEGNQIWFSSGASTARNCVFWSDEYNPWTFGTINMYYCAYTGISPSGTNFAINTSNTASDGPNFTDPSSGDWTIQFISPLRDAGTTPSPTVPTDYAGNNRVGAYDIGAYEVPYSRWTGTTSTEWATSTNWSGGYYPGATGSTGDIIIPNGLTNYPTSTPAPSVTISADKYLILESNAKATMASLRNSGILRLESDSTGTASLIMGSYNNNSGAGTEEIELYLSGGSDPNNKWHFISIPIANFDHSPISDTTLNLARYDENSLLDAGWVAYDGYVYYTQTMDGGAFSTLSIGKGYNYFYDRDVTYTLSGRLYTKTVNIGLSYSGSTPGSKVYGFNLLGNPFSSGLDWDAIVYVDGDVEAGVLNDNYPDNTSAAVFFTKDDEQVTYVAGVLSTSDEFDGVIPPMQGFFVKTYSTGNTISLPQAARTHGVKTSLFKGNSRSTIPLIRLGIGKGTEVLDQTVVRFNQKALFGIDNFYDAVKLLKQEGRNYISTTIDTTEFSINGVPFPAEDECMEIPISLTLAEEADYNISVSNLQNLDDYELSIVDLATNDTTKITASTTLSFHAAAGELNERFVLLISPSSGDLPTYTPEIILPKAAADFTIYQSYNMINIEPATGNWDGITTRVSVINLAGQRVATHNAIGIQSGSISQIEAPATKGFYLVEIIGNNRRYVGKVVIR
jgi:predicted outer membrane repeat protein